MKATEAPGLARRVDDQLGDRLALVDQHRFLAADQSGGAEVRRVVDLGDDVVVELAVAAAFGQGEDRLDHLRVRFLLVLGGEDDDRARPLRPHHGQVAEVDRRAAAADHPRPLRPHLLADQVVHFDLVAFGEDDRRGLLAALVGDLELGEDGEDRVRPAEDQRVVLLEHDRAALAHLFDPRVEAGGDHPDQGADHEEAAEGDQQHRDQEGPVLAGVAGDRPRVERVQKAVEGLADDPFAGCFPGSRGRGRRSRRPR